MLYNSRSEGSERIIQVPGCDDCIGLGPDTNLVSVVVAPLGADVSNVLIDAGSLLGQKLNVQTVSGADRA